MSAANGYPDRVTKFAENERSNPKHLNRCGLMEDLGISYDAAKGFVKQVKTYLWETYRLRYGHDPEINGYRIMPTNRVVAERMINYDIGLAASEVNDAALSVLGGVERKAVSYESGAVVASSLIRHGADIAETSDLLVYTDIEDD